MCCVTIIIILILIIDYNIVTPDFLLWGQISSKLHENFPLCYSMVVSGDLMMMIIFKNT